jgi:hypothetical protein
MASSFSCLCLQESTDSVNSYSVLVVLNLAGFPKFRVQFSLVKPLSSICLLFPVMCLTIVFLSAVTVSYGCGIFVFLRLSGGPRSHSLSYVCENLAFRWPPLSGDTRSHFTSFCSSDCGPLSLTLSRLLRISRAITLRQCNLVT